MQRTTEKEARAWLQSNAPHIHLRTWGGSARQTSVFFDTKIHREFQQQFRTVKAKLSKKPETVFGKITQEEAKFWLARHGPRFKLLLWADGARGQSTFLDEKRGIEFRATFTYVKSRLEQGKVLFAPSKQETKVKLQKRAKETQAGKRLQLAVHEKFGVKNVSELANIVEKRNKSLRAKTEQQKKYIQLKREKTCMRRYGVTNVSKNSIVQEKRKQTNKNRFGADHPMKNLRILNKVRNTKVGNGNMVVVGDLSIRELAVQKGCSYSQLSFIYRKKGEKAVQSYELSQTFIEQSIKNLLIVEKVQFQQNKILSGTPFRPDFKIDTHRLIIECDGLYWHSDAKVTKNYHQKKKFTYLNRGYHSLFFREDEILNKPDIVASIILNRLGRSQRVFARKCLIQKLTRQQSCSFFTYNHLMGAGSGKTYALVGPTTQEILSAIQVKWRCKKTQLLEISRFASKMRHLVVGGFSRLFKKVLFEEQPSTVMTFVDLRYGAGDYFCKLGWSKKSENLSFKWCKNQQTVHRLQFPSNEGYKHGYFKIWDCGQAKYEFKVCN